MSLHVMGEANRNGEVMGGVMADALAGFNRDLRPQAAAWTGRTLVLDYDTREFPFANLVGRHLNIYDLARCHELADYPLFKRETDQKTMFHKRFYTIGQEFFDTYRRFVKAVAEPVIGDEAVFQKIPTFRVHLPNNLGVGEFHRDRDYSHQVTEINFWLPLTDAWESNSIYIESQEGKQDYTPWTVRYGQVLVFDGANLSHGNQINQTGSTRVSFDFRVIPKSRYTDGAGASVNMGTAFKIGGDYTI